MVDLAIIRPSIQFGFIVAHFFYLASLQVVPRQAAGEPH